MFCLIHKLKELELIPNKQIQFRELSFEEYAFSLHWKQFILIVSKEMHTVPIGLSKVTPMFPYGM